MALTGFRVKSPIAKVFKNLRGSVKASAFEPDVVQFLKRSLTTAIQLTPARSTTLIRRAQKKQYAHRINYIPSFHTVENPTLIVNKNDEHWVYYNGSWYHANLWRLNAEVSGIYDDLLRERERRMQTGEQQFIDGRMQARFLFKRSWWEIGQSVGIDVACSPDVKQSHTRRAPPLNPPRGYAQKRGGKSVFSIVVRNPFLDQTSPGGHAPLSTEQYKPFSGEAIIGTAMDKHRPAFEEKVAQRQTKAILKVLRLIAKFL